MNNNLVVTLGCRLNYWESNKINSLMEESGKKNILGRVLLLQCCKEKRLERTDAGCWQSSECGL